jgi:hypothetical protein
MAKVKLKKQEIVKIIEAVETHRGLKSVVAKALKVSRTTIYNWCEEYPEIDLAFQDARYALVDIAESRLVKNVEEGKEPSVFFLLKCLGKDRGYVEKELVTINNITNGDVRQFLTDMDDSVSRT